MTTPQTGEREHGRHLRLDTVGDRVTIRLVNVRLVNEREGSEHRMRHPFHIHGVGRFLVLAR